MLNWSELCKRSTSVSTDQAVTALTVGDAGLWSHQKLDPAHTEGAGATDVVCQPSRGRYHHMRLVGQLQGLAHHVW